jgi:pimeloyl-ACP methyl ester carboxylesterase
LLTGSQKVPTLLAKTFAGRASGVANRLTGEVRKIPREHWPLIAANWSEERAFRTMADYLENLPLSASQLDETLSLGSLPVAVLSAETASAEAKAEHEHDANLSTRGDHEVVPGTGHWINLDAPESIANAIQRIFRATPRE